MYCDDGLHKSCYQILSQEDWDNMYSIQDYKNKTVHTKKFVLHYLLALNQSDELILSYIEKIKDPSILSRVDTKNSALTPLLIATMKGRFKVVQVLFNTYKTLGKSISDEKDSFRWTVMHHAKLSSKEIFEFLSKQGVSTGIKNALMGTPEDIRSFVDYEITPLSIHRTYYQTLDGALIPVSEVGQEKMRELMGIKEYRDHRLYPENELKRLWQLEVSEEVFTFSKQYQHYLKNPPRLIIRPCQELGKNSFGLGLELCAGEDLKYGAMVSEYTGIVSKEIRISKTFIEGNSTTMLNKMGYCLLDVDAKDVGNASRYANCGWPNVNIVEVYEKGTPRYMLMVIAPEGIKKNEPIFYDYGITYPQIGFNTPILFGRSKMRDYFAKQSLTSQFCNFQNSIQALSLIDKPTVKQLLYPETLESYFTFPLNNPWALIDLHFSEKVPINEWLHLYLDKGASFIIDWVNAHPTYYQRVQSLMFRIQEYENSLSDQNELKKSFGEWVLNKLGNLSIMQILKAMDDVVQHSKGQQWSTFERELEIKLKPYDWTLDPEAPLGLKRCREDLIKVVRSFINSGKKSKLEVFDELLETVKYWETFPDKESYEDYNLTLYLMDQLEMNTALQASFSH